jgi:hypothetical protein
MQQSVSGRSNHFVTKFYKESFDFSFLAKPNDTEERNMNKGYLKL